MRIRNLMLISLMGFGFANAAQSNLFKPVVTTDKKVGDYFHKLLPTTTINKIYTTPWQDTYALLSGSNVIYGNLKSNYLTVGHMFDITNMKDLTEVIQKENTPKIDLKNIDTSDALVVKAPTKVNKKLIIFIDPDCPYCRQLEAQIFDQGINKKADIYYMLMPLPMHPNAKDHVKNILCSTDQIGTLKEYMIKNNESPTVTLEEGCNIEAVMERVGSVARGLAINGAPAIVTGDGVMIMGADIQAISDYVNQK